MNWSRLKSATKCLGRCVSTQTLRPAYVKHKIPEKRSFLHVSVHRQLVIVYIFILFLRASSLMNILRNEELQRLKNGREWPEIKPGDSISIDKKPYMTSTETETVKGVVIAKTNKQGDSALRILNVRKKNQNCILYKPVFCNYYFRFGTNGRLSTERRSSA